MFRRPLRYYYLRLVRQAGTPEKVAGGLAIGIFVGLCFPPFGQQMVIALLLAMWLKCSKLPAAAGAWITNPLTMPFIYPMQLTIGGWITGISVSGIVPTNRDELWHFVTNAGEQGTLIVVWLTGAVATAICGTFVSYHGAKELITRYRWKKQQRLEARRQKQRQIQAEREALKGVRGDAEEPG